MLKRWIVITGLCAAIGSPAALAQGEPQDPTHPAAEQDAAAESRNAMNADASAPVEREVHVLRIEFLRGGDLGRWRVMVDGEAADPVDGQFLIRLISRLRGQVFASAAWRPESGGDGDAASTTTGIDDRDVRPVGADEHERQPSHEQPEDGANPSLELDGHASAQPRVARRDQSSASAAESEPALELSAEEIDDIMMVIADFEPTLHERMLTLQSTSASLFIEKIGEDSDRWMRLGELKESQPDEYETELRRYSLSRDLFDLQIKYKVALDEGRDDEAARIREKLSGVVAEQFALEQKQRESELGRYEQQILMLRSRMRARELRRDEIIDDRVDRLLDFEGFDLDEFDVDDDGGSGR